MTTKIELLPLPEGEASSFGDYQVHDNEAMIEYARANVALNTALLQAEIKALRAEVERLKAATTVTMGVGSGGGNLFVHGDYESIKAAQAIVLERDALRAEVAEWKARADDLAAALNKCIKLAYIRDLDELPSAIIMTATRAVDKYDMLADLGD